MIPYENQDESSKALDQREHVTGANAKRVVPSYKNIADGGFYDTDVLTERYDYASSPIYVGVAPIGTLDDEAGWVINQYDLTDTSDASGKVATDVTWEDRATGTYL